MVNAALVVGLPTAAVSAALYGLAPLIQAMAARREAAGKGVGLGLLAKLALRPLWLAGLAVETVSFLLEVYALSVAPVALVAPVMAMDMVVFALLARRFLGERISRTGFGGIGAMVVGILLLAYAFEVDADVGHPATEGQLLAFLVLGLVFALTAGLVADRSSKRGRVTSSALGFGLAAGVSYAIAVARHPADRPVRQRAASGEAAVIDLMATPTPYVLVLFSILALGLQQRGLQGRAAVVAFPVTSGVSAFLPVTLGLSLFGEPAPRRAPDGGVRGLAGVGGRWHRRARQGPRGDVRRPRYSRRTGMRRPGRSQRPGQRLDDQPGLPGGGGRVGAAAGRPASRIAVSTHCGQAVAEYR